VVIAGGGLGALRTAQALRDLDFDGSVTLLCAEETPPYDRPPLSKGFLLGQAEEDDLLLASAEKLDELRVQVRLGARAVGLDRMSRQVRLHQGGEVPYDDLVVATGARPNRLPMFAGLDGVIHLRDLGDARTLRSELAARPRLGIVGGGFIGLEIASVARELGCEVSVIEAAAAPLAPILGAEVGGWVQAWHEEQGVIFRCGAPLAAVHGQGRPEQLVLTDGRIVDVDLIVVGVGVTPDVGWLGEAGLQVHRGLVCDAAGRTSDPHVFGVGDVTCRHAGDSCTPSGHWTATGEQARAAAHALLGRPPEGRPVQEGYFWSDQFGRRLQFTGRVSPGAHVSLSSGSVEDRKFVALFADAGQVTGVFAMNSPREFVRTSLTLRAHAVDNAGTATVASQNN
jgi:3-phenylpropionate/trans-cinnamate dioxygenase ferredoxin reductase subunit